MPKPAWLALILTLAAGPAAAQPAPTWQTLAPFFEARCVGCHFGDFAPRGLQLDTYANAIKGSSNGPVLIPGNPDGSELIRRVRGLSLPQMPLAGTPLTEAEIAPIVAWIEAGLPEGGAVEATAMALPVVPGPQETVTFTHVERIFQQRCVLCHSDAGQLPAPPEGLRLDSYANILGGGERVVAVPGRPELSELIRRVVGLSQPRMPANGPSFLNEGDIDLLRRWIADGAQDASGVAAPLPVGGEIRFRGVFTAQWSIDDAPFRLGPDARVEDELRPGQAAELRAIVTADGALEATRLRAR